MTLSGMRGVLSEAVSIYFADVTRQRICCPLVRRQQGRDYRERVLGTRG